MNNIANKMLAIISKWYHSTPLRYHSNLSPIRKFQLYMACIKPVVHHSFEAWVHTHKYKIPNLQMIQNRCLRMIGKYLRIKKANFLHADFSVLKVDEYL
jgi:hypothetical protein